MIKIPFKIHITKNNILLVLSSVIVIYLLIHYIFTGITTQPSEGDSVNLHIPIAKRILTGRILYPNNKGIPDEYPASSELILAAFIALHVPLNLYNVLATVVLFFALVSLGKTFGLSKNFSLMFAFSLCSLYGVLRYVDTQKIDIWLLVFYACSLQLLQKPEKKFSYFLKLGFALGMVVGSKFSGPFYVIILLGFYVKDVIKSVTINRLLAFLLPFSLFGLIWYVRNYVNFGNPFYPQSFLFFKGEPHGLYYAWPYWKIALTYPKELINAIISEYMIWVLSLVVLLFMFTGNICLNKFRSINPIKKIVVLGVLNFILFLFLPAAPAHDYNAIVFGIRYSFPALLTIMLVVFCIADIYKQNELITVTTFLNMSFLIFSFPYHPKLLFIFVPLVTILILSLAGVLKISFDTKLDT